MNSNRILSFLVFIPSLIAVLADPGFGQKSTGSRGYDPLKIEKTRLAEVIHRDFAVTDSNRDREIPIRTYFEKDQKNPQPVILFSHGLGGSKTNNAYLAKHWTAREYVCVFLQHPGSDEAVWKNERLAKRMAAMRKAASGKNYVARVDDVKKVLDQLQAWNRDPKHPLHQRMDLEHIGMSGHSFGAHTSQAVGGQWYPVIGQKYTDRRIDGVVAFSPSSPKRGDAGKAFEAVSIPWLLMTGTHDESRLSDQTPESRLKVYPALSKRADKYELLLNRAEHSAFSDRALPGDRQKRNPNHHRVIVATSTAFWDAVLKKNNEARKWLQSDQPRSLLEKGDRWQFEKSKIDK